MLFLGLMTGKKAIDIIYKEIANDNCFSILKGKLNSRKLLFKHNILSQK
jgi:hypothetical protein